MQSFVFNNLTAKTAKRLRGYLIRLTRGYTDGGMVSRPEESYFFSYSAKTRFLLSTI